ncbi:LysR family transcriptional regulator [Alkalibacter mobilis]|uniref:LysR family transcriptional regulator n=1 Tax=Alkalibacter mobilis TaxID=2787712 RepID=UPI0018A047B5|nr:LysR family transcriptional regulator [Alkalibacter mobilis]MBF7097550.1 LysR family transcriptional regulator [Alkalibacter mobilis]
MNIRHMEFFIEICKEKSTSKASKNLHISQQGLSKAIKSLENEIGFPLFDRTTNGLVITEYGKQFKDHAMVILNEYQLMHQQIRLLSNNKKKSLYLGYAEGIFYMLPKNFISQFMLDYPDINIILKRYQDKECENAVLSKEVDLAFTTSPIIHSELKTLLKFRSEVYAVINKEHPLAAKESITINDLKRERIIALNTDTKCSLTLNTLNSLGIEPKLFINPSELNIQFDLCSANMAIGFYSGNPEHLPQNLLLKPVTNFKVSDEYVVITLNETPVTDTMNYLMESLINSVNSGFSNNEKNRD